MLFLWGIKFKFRYIFLDGIMKETEKIDKISLDHMLLTILDTPGASKKIDELFLRKKEIMVFLNNERNYFEVETDMSISDAYPWGKDEFFVMYLEAKEEVDRFLGIASKHIPRVEYYTPGLKLNFLKKDMNHLKNSGLVLGSALAPVAIYAGGLIGGLITGGLFMGVPLGLKIIDYSFDFYASKSGIQGHYRNDTIYVNEYFKKRFDMGWLVNLVVHEYGHSLQDRLGICFSEKSYSEGFCCGLERNVMGIFALNYGFPEFNRESVGMDIEHLDYVTNWLNFAKGNLEVCKTSDAIRLLLESKSVKQNAEKFGNVYFMLLEEKYGPSIYRDVILEDISHLYDISF